jgi:hypothetical protein
MVQSASVLYRHTLNIEQGTTILLYKVFYKGKDNSISLGMFIFILLQGLRKLILLKTKDMCTSLTVIGVTKIMCNTIYSKSMEWDPTDVESMKGDIIDARSSGGSRKCKPRGVMQASIVQGNKRSPHSVGHWGYQ